MQGCDWVCDFTENGIVGAEGTVPSEQAALTDTSLLACRVDTTVRVLCVQHVWSHSVVPHCLTVSAGWAWPVLAGIPEDVAEYLAAIQVRVEEELAFIDSSSIYGRIVAVGASWHQDASSGGWVGGMLWQGVGWLAAW